MFPFVLKINFSIAPVSYTHLDVYKRQVEMLSEGKRHMERRKYLAEYDKYIEETIQYDKEHEIIISIMKDVTDEQREAPVSYTHLDVYKRQATQRWIPTGTNATGRI